MADEEETDPERSSGSTTNRIVTTIGSLERRFQELLDAVATDGTDSRVQASAQYCQDFCRVRFTVQLVNPGGRVVTVAARRRRAERVTRCFRCSRCILHDINIELQSSDIELQSSAIELQSSAI